MKLNNKKTKVDNIVLNELERLSKIENDDLFASELDKFIEKSKTGEFYEEQDEINLEAEGLPNVVMYDKGRKFKYVDGKNKGKNINIKKDSNREYIRAHYNGKEHEKTVSFLKHKYYSDFEGWVNLECIAYPNYWCNPEKGLIKNRFGEILGKQDGDYIRVELYNKYGSKKHSIHRIVAHLAHGIDLYDESIDVNHKNENKLDNRACNLIPLTRKQNTTWSATNKTGYTNIHQYKNGKYYYMITKYGFKTEEEAYGWRCWAMPIAGIEDLKEGFREPINRDKEWMSLDIVDCPNYVINQKGKILNLTKCSIENHTEKDYINGYIHIDKKSGKKYHSVTLINSKGKRQSLQLHILLAKCFIYNPDPEKYNKVDHDDNNSLNNNLGNLQWTIQRHNVSKDAKRKGKYSNVIQYENKFSVQIKSNSFNTPEEAQEDMKRVFKLIGLEYVDRNELRANEEIPE